MMNVTMIGRTAKVVRSYSCEERQGRNGSFESKSILFSFACDRKYRTTTVVNGQQRTDSPTDFWLVKFVGAAAEKMNQYATAKKPDGSLISRYMYLEGTFETYKSTKPIKGTMHGVNCGNGQTMDVNGQLVPDGSGITQVIFVVDYFWFLDSNAESGTQAPQQAAANMQMNPQMQMMQQQMQMMQNMMASMMGMGGFQQPQQPVQNQPFPNAMQNMMSNVAQGMVQNQSVPTQPMPQTQAPQPNPVAPPTTAAPSQQAPATAVAQQDAQAPAPNPVPDPSAPAAPTVPSAFSVDSGAAPF